MELNVCSCVRDATVYFGGDSDGPRDTVGAALVAVAAGSAAAADADSAAEGGKRAHADGESHGKPLAPSREGESDVAAALKNLTTSASECSEASRVRPGEPCSSEKVIDAIKAFRELVGAKKGERPAKGPGEASALPTNNTPAAAAVRQVARALACSSESCVLKHPEFKRFAVSEGPIRHARVLDAELATRFKPAGPRDSLELLNNFNIDAVLQGWASAFPKFHNYPFSMMDFDSTGGPLARISPVDILEGRATQSLGKALGPTRRPCDTFACVLNTDVSSGRGKHWVAVFGDCRSRGTWSVEYFNSAGNPPPGPVTRWLEETAANLRNHRIDRADRFGDGEIVTVPLTDVRHQDSATECGLYALYYIRRRLEGAPFEEFRGHRIPDEAMTEFRAHVFRGK